MVSEAPKIEGLFPERSYGFGNTILWYSVIRNNPLTSDCQVIGVGWYKMGKGEEREFLRFDISSPDNQHTCIVIAERSCGGVRSSNYDATQAADTLAQTDTVVDATASPLTPPGTSALSPDVGDPTASSADESGPPLDKVTKSDGKKKQKTNTAQIAASFSSSSKRHASDLVYCATRISAAGDWVEEMCDRPRLVCALSFTGAKPTANELATLLYVTSAQEPKYNLHDTQCHWFAATVFDALNILYEGAEKDLTPHRGGTICGVPVDFKASGEEVCAKYRDARAALAEEVEQPRRLKQEQEEERQREREQRQVAEEAAKRAEDRRAAEERAQAAQEEIAKLQREREALGALFEGAERVPKNNRGGTWARLLVSKKESVDAVRAKYRKARAALAEEIELGRRLKQEQEEERQSEREQRQAAEEAAKRAEEERQREREQREVAEQERQAAEERARAAEEEGQRERQAAEESAQKERAAEKRARAVEEANAKLLQEVEALKRAGTSTQQA